MKVGLIMITLCALVACADSPAGPTPTAPPSAASFAGQYALTLQIDEGCAEFPESLRVWAYDASLEDTGYLAVRIVGGAFREPTVVGQLYAHGNAGFRLILNVHYEFFDRYPESRELLLYGGGDGTGTGTGSSISGELRGTAGLTGRSGNPCYGSHRFMFNRRI